MSIKAKRAKRLLLLNAGTYAQWEQVETIGDIIGRTVKGTVWVLEGTYELTKGTAKLVYHIGKFTFEVVRAPLEWPLTNDDIETIGGLPVKEAI